MKKEETTNESKSSPDCPHGSFIQEPIGTIKPIKVGDENCRSCQLFVGKKDNQVLCQLIGSSEILKIDL
jgi:hypothetical protein